jgi:hypothetical protein
MDTTRGDRDVFQWLPVTVVDRDGAALSYSLLHFPEVPDVIHKTKSVFSGSVLVKACIDRRMATGHQVFTLSRYGVYLVVTDAVKAAIAGAGCTGIEFSRMPSE